jgi:vitamin B12/bleomycin/antimicrobial peptide transport system ATP-binding/permease protein
MHRTTLHATAARFVAAVKSFATSDVGGNAKLIFAALVVLLLVANLLNVINSYVGRNFFSAIQERNRGEYIRQAFFYVGVFAASTFVAIIARFAEERLGLLWRDFVTRRSVARYLAGGAYYRMEAAGELANPDQRIAEDARAFTTTTLSFVLMLLNSGFTIIAFSGVLWSISPKLFAVAVLYAASGSLITIMLARPLVKLNYDQLDKEASFRSELLHVRQKSESILLGSRERQLGARLLNRLDSLVANFRRIIAVNRNVGFVSTGYNWLIQIIPVLIIAPLFMKGDIEFGVITQSAMAFTALVAAFSLIVREFQSISNFAAVVSRLDVLLDALERSQIPTRSGIRVVEAEGRLAYERLTLLLPRNSGPLLQELTISIPAGTRVLVTGSNPPAARALFRATAGMEIPGSGQIRRPGSQDFRFLPHRPYLPPGSLREILEDVADRRPNADERIIAMLRELGLEEVFIQAGGLDQEHDWSTRISSREQHLLALARILLAAPQFVFLDRVGETLGSEQAQQILRMLSERSITYVNSGAPDGGRDLYDAFLECKEDGSWSWRCFA